MITKICFKCGGEKSLDDFYSHPETSDGKLGKCKVCARRDVTKNRNSNIERVREYDRSRGSRMTADQVKRYRSENPEKYKAHIYANNAVRDGKLFPPDKCEGPGCESLGPFHKHHEDYSKPLDVEWYCPACHHSKNFNR
jgi:hypothetical protein